MDSLVKQRWERKQWKSKVESVGAEIAAFMRWSFSDCPYWLPEDHYKTWGLGGERCYPGTFIPPMEEDREQDVDDFNNKELQAIKRSEAFMEKERERYQRRLVREEKAEAKRKEKEEKEAKRIAYIISYEGRVEGLLRYFTRLDRNGRIAKRILHYGILLKHMDRMDTFYYSSAWHQPGYQPKGKKIMYEEIANSWATEIDKVGNAGSQDYEEIPDGEYVVYVDKMTLKMSSRQNPMFSWQLRVMSGEHEGRVLFKNSMAKTSMNLRYLAEDMAAAGFDRGKLKEAKRPVYEDEATGQLMTDIPLEELVDRALRVRKHTRVIDGKPAIPNVFINQYLGMRQEVEENLASSAVGTITLANSITEALGLTRKKYDDEEIPF